MKKFNQTMNLSPQQNRILHTLLPVAHIAVNGGGLEGSLQARTHTLICAPSGAGKSYLMKKLGELLKVPVLILNVSTWQPLGSRGENYTWDQIVQFLKRIDQGIIVLDELDKLGGSLEWSGFVRLEIHDLLDGIIPMSVRVTPDSCGDADSPWIEKDEVEDNQQSMDYRNELQGKLRKRVFLVGGGAWQSLWSSEEVSRRSIGFISETSVERSDSKIDHKTLQSSIAPELLKRFRYDVLIMNPMREADYLQMLDLFLKPLALDLQGDFRKFAESQISEAVKSKIGMRFFEEILTQVLVARSEERCILRKKAQKEDGGGSIPF